MQELELIERPEQRQRGDPIVIVCFGSPESGKSTLFQALESALRAIGIEATHIDQDKPLETDLACLGMRASRERLQEECRRATDAAEIKYLRSEISNLFLSALKVIDHRIQRMSGGIVLLEHPIEFAVAIDKALGASLSQLKRRSKGLRTGNFGVFLEISPAEILATGRSSPLLKNLKRANMAYDHMKMMADRDPEYWIRIDARQSKEDVFGVAMREICNRYRAFLDGCINRRPLFEFPVGKAKRGVGGTT